MIVLFDTNVILDVLLDREPFVEVALGLFGYVEQNRVQGYLCATTLTNIFYIARPTVGKDVALRRVQELLEIFDVAVVNQVILKRAVATRFTDFEDAVLYESAQYAGVDAIVTRNISDFENSDIPIYSPNDLSVLLDLKEDGE